MLSDYSKMEREIKDAPKPRILPNGTEVRARIIRVESGIIEDESKKSYGAKYYNVLLDVPADPLCPIFRQFFWELADRDKIPEEQFRRALPQFREFAACFGIDYSRPFNWETDLERLEGDIVLGIKKDKEGQYADQNNIREFIVPK